MDYIRPTRRILARRIREGSAERERMRTLATVVLVYLSSGWLIATARA
jgi:hypothetical protein